MSKKKLYIHSRIHRNHPNINNIDVRDAWNSILVSAPRMDGSKSYIALGVDGRGRLLEMVFIYNKNGQVLIYHAMTPPSKKTMTELTDQLRKREL